MASAVHRLIRSLYILKGVGQDQKGVASAVHRLNRSTHVLMLQHGLDARQRLHEPVVAGTPSRSIRQSQFVKVHPVRPPVALILHAAQRDTFTVMFYPLSDTAGPASSVCCLSLQAGCQGGNQQSGLIRCLSLQCLIRCLLPQGLIRCLSLQGLIRCLSLQGLIRCLTLQAVKAEISIFGSDQVFVTSGSDQVSVISGCQSGHHNTVTYSMSCCLRCSYYIMPVSGTFKPM